MVNVSKKSAAVESNTQMIQSQEILSLLQTIQTVDEKKTISNLEKSVFHNDDFLKINEMSFYRIKSLSYDEDYPHREAFENVLLSLDNMAFNFAYILTGTQQGVDLCIGVVENEFPNEPVLGRKLSANDYGKIIANSFAGNFVGSDIVKINKSEIESILNENYSEAGVITGVPSVNEKDGSDEYDFQGIDRLITSMLGLNWRIILVCEPVCKSEIIAIKEDLYDLYNRLSIYSKKNVQIGQNNGVNVSFSKNTSDSKNKNEGWNESESASKGGSSGSENTKSWNHSKSLVKSGGKSEGHTVGESRSISMSSGSSTAITIEIANKKAQELMKYIDEEMLCRFNLGFSKGLYKTSLFYMSDAPAHADRLKASIMSLFQGNKSKYSPLVAQKIDLQQGSNNLLLKNFQNRYFSDLAYSQDMLLLLSRPFYGTDIGLSTYLTGGEVSLLAGLPQKEVPGITLREAVTFGLNEKNIDVGSDIKLGWMVQKGRELPCMSFYINRDALKKHTFIAGTTGSGKTTTCHRLLLQSKDVPFLVIEPAKTEYRTLINSELVDDLIVFTPGNETVAPFRINPFELIPGEIISAHVDMLKATFTSAFPMEASMPQLLEEAIYKCYRDKGWNVDTNRNDKYGMNAFGGDVDAFPILSDLLAAMTEVVKAKGFSQKLQSDYIGSLVSRLSNLTVGSKGAMLNCSHSIDFSYIAHHNVVLELEELKSPEDKALIMGFVLSRLSAVIKEEHRKNPRYRHITLVEEAHRLLSKVEYGDSGSKKTAVETFTDLLAEVRKYGEGLIIVDQIPNKLASEVLKNTNTKIIHKILAKDDKEAVGDTMLMDDKQKEYLSALKVGEAVIFTENTDKPVHVHIDRLSDTSEEQIENDVVINRFLEYRNRFGSVYNDLEIVPYYLYFDDLCQELSNRSIDHFKRLRMQEIVKHIADTYHEEPRNIWKKFVLRREKLTGKAAANMETAEKRVNFFVDFFDRTFYKNSFSEEDLYDMDLNCCYL